jgi:hypothetical protein
LFDFQTTIGRRLIMKSRFFLVLLLCISLPAQARDLTKEERIQILENQVVQLMAALAANTDAIAAATHPRYTDLEAVAAAGPHYNDTDAIAAVGPHFSGDHGDLTNVTSDMHHVTQAPNVIAIQDLLAGVSRVEFDPITGVETLTFTNMNVQVVSGSGETDAWVNGTGNIIIGYNENGNFNGDDKSGSHMLVIGSANNYSSYGGIVSGMGNDTSGAYSSITGGQRNTASGFASSITGGAVNIADASYSSVSGGLENIACEYASSVSGGYMNIAAENYSSVSGGLENTASWNFATVSGGWNNDASGYASTVSGGQDRTASDTSDWVAGGLLQDN